MLIDDIIEEIKSSFLSLLISYKNTSKTERNKIIYLFEFFESMENEYGNAVISKVENDYKAILDDIMKYKVSGIYALTYRELKVIIDLDLSKVLRRFKQHQDFFKKCMIFNMLYGENTNIMAAELIQKGFDYPDGIAAVNTARDCFHAASMASLFQDSPHVRFVLAGPIDDRTRCQCKAVMLNQRKEGYTKKEIDEGAWTKLVIANCPKFKGKYTFVFRGGFDCRHIIQIAG